ncbi:hypothetical protein [Snodgrassella sp.]|uniref:hypothetical protein n=1 Tax=Snodgrassella sp. TaxID=2815304 RepID=UPI00258278D2|nr:hypothetical protein [Snodgrassella sp.]MCO6527157.1 hypothetical protein [Snodgrassella sp.]
MRYLISILRKLMSFFMLYSLVCLAQADEQDSVYNAVENQLNLCNFSKNNTRITSLFPVDNDSKYLNGIYYGVVKKNRNNYLIKLYFENSFLKYIEIQDNKLRLGIKDNSEKIVLHIPCQDIYQNEFLCKSNKILFNNPNHLKDIKKLCLSNLKHRKIPKTSYLPDIVVEYLYFNGINIKFLNDLFKYQTKITNGIVDTF